MVLQQFQRGFGVEVRVEIRELRGGDLDGKDYGVGSRAAQG